MRHIYSSTVCTLVEHVSNVKDVFGYPSNARKAYIYLSSLSFGIPNRRNWGFLVYYNKSHRFNVSELKLPRYRETPRSKLPDVQVEPTEFDLVNKAVMEQWPMGYDTAAMKEYNPELFNKSVFPFYKIALDTPAPPVSETSMYWIHPEESRLLVDEEYAALAGVEDWRNDIPKPIIDWLMRQVKMCENHEWGDEDFEATYCGESGWIIEDLEQPKEEKTFDLQYYVPMYVPMCSRVKGCD